MKFWVNAQLSPALAPWISDTFAVEAFSVRWFGFQHASDEEIFAAARRENVVVITKDRDFVRLLERLGPPPQLIWVTCGNTLNVQMRRILRQTFPKALALLQADESLVEITDIS